MTDDPDDWPALLLYPEDAQSVRTAGRDFARALCGCPGSWFMVALGEQGAILREAVEHIGFDADKAEIAAATFESAARVEWQRIASTAGPETWGTA
jgi:hypothetical protein